MLRVAKYSHGFNYAAIHQGFAEFFKIFDLIVRYVSNQLNTGKGMTAKEELEERVSAALEKAGAQVGSPALVGLSTRPEFGDYQVNGVMSAAKKMKTNNGK